MWPLFQMAIYKTSSWYCSNWLLPCYNHTDWLGEKHQVTCSNWLALFLIFVIPIREELWSALVKDKYHCITITQNHTFTDLEIRTWVGLWSQTDQKRKCLNFDHVGMLPEKLMLDTWFLFCWICRKICYIGHMSHLLLLKACCSSSSSNCSILSFSVCY